MEDLQEPAFAEIDTDSFEVLSSHPFCRGLRKEAAGTAFALFECLSAKMIRPIFCYGVGSTCST